jgi:hypothetical protein
MTKLHWLPQSRSGAPNLQQSRPASSGLRASEPCQQHRLAGGPKEQAEGRGQEYPLREEGHRPRLARLIR